MASPSIDWLTSLFKLNTMVLSDPWPTHRLDAIYVFAQADGPLKDQRLQRLLEAISKDAPRVALCAGKGQGYAGYEAWAKELVERGVAEASLYAIPAPPVIHTASEAQQLVHEAQKYGWKRIVLISSPHHQLRACMSVVAQIRNHGSNLAIYNLPGSVISWWEEVAHYQGEIRDTMYGFIEQEMQRIQQFQEKGDVASCEETLEYLHQRDLRSSICSL